MKKRTAAFFLLCAMTALILDSKYTSQSALSAVDLCIRTLIPNLFPLFVLTGLLVPRLSGLRLSFLTRLLGIPGGSEGIFFLGCAGGFPVGAACIARAAENGGIDKTDAERMLGFCSFCGPSFLFGVLGSILSLSDALILFLIQLQTAVLTAAFWPYRSVSAYHPPRQHTTLTAAVRRSIFSMATVCAWVILAGVLTGFLGRWLFPFLPDALAVLLTGLLELTNGVFSLDSIQDPSARFLLSTVFVCFGGVSVLLQISGLAADAGLSLSVCIAQKTIQATLGAILAVLYVRFGPVILLLPFVPLFVKIAVEIPSAMVYNSRRKEGI